MEELDPETRRTIELWDAMAAANEEARLAKQSPEPKE